MKFGIFIGKEKPLFAAFIISQLDITILEMARMLWQKDAPV